MDGTAIWVDIERASPAFNGRDAEVAIPRVLGECCYKISRKWDILTLSNFAEQIPVEDMPPVHVHLVLIQVDLLSGMGNYSLYVRLCRTSALPKGNSGVL